MEDAQAEMEGAIECNETHPWPGFLEREHHRDTHGSSNRFAGT